jgi:hypothetical protein
MDKDQTLLHRMTRGSFDEEFDDSSVFMHSSGLLESNSRIDVKGIREAIARVEARAAQAVADQKAASQPAATTPAMSVVTPDPAMLAAAEAKRQQMKQQQEEALRQKLSQEARERADKQWQHAAPLPPATPMPAPVVQLSLPEEEHASVAANAALSALRCRRRQLSPSRKTVR